MRIAFINGKIYIKFKPLEKSESIVVESGKIIFSGPTELSLKKAEKIVDLKGRTLMPGFIDAHMHLDELGMYLNILDLRNIRSIEELRNKLKKFAENHPGPIMGHGWDQELFLDKRWPNKHDIDDIVNDRPVILTRVCLHAALVNSYFLKIMNYESEDGIIKENDFETFRKKFNSLINRENKKKFILDGINELIKNGITSIGFVSCSKEIFQILKDLDKEKKIPIRINVYLNAEDFSPDINFKNSEHLKLKGIKLFVDGSLGARTALLSEKYNDADTFGEKVFDENYLKIYIENATKENFQVAIHAIGDRAMDIAISLLKNHPGGRIEHCSVVRDDQLEKLKKINLVVQPHFVLTDFWVLDRLGEERARFVYRFKDLSRISNLAFSTDAPVEPINPFLTLYAAVTRGKFENIPISKYQDQAMDVQEAIYHYTKCSAIALNESSYGELVDGNYADFIILDKDPLSIDEKDLEKINVDEVYISGERISENIFK